MEAFFLKKSREAWQRLYAKHGIQYGGSGDIGPLEQVLRPGMRVLDAGCGDGKTTEILAKRAEVVACDFSREALTSMRQQRGKDMDANLVECELGSLPFADEKFDAVACVHSLSHMMERDRAGAAREIVRTVVPGGHVLIEGFSPDDLRYGVGEEVERASFLRGSGIMTHYFEPHEIQHIFEGLEAVSETTLVRRVSFGARAGKRSVVRVLMRKPVSDNEQSN